MLGYPGVQQHKTTNFTPVKGISWLDWLHCTGAETSIGDCQRGDPWGDGSTLGINMTLVCCVNG